jgi:hypothetical protein
MAERKAVTKQLARSYRAGDRVRKRAAAPDERGDNRQAPAGERAKRLPRGRSHTKPGSLLKSQIPIRTWAQWDDAVRGFVEIDLVGHEGSNSSGQYCFTLTVTDISTGWTVNRSVPNRAQKHVFTALQHAMNVFPFPVIGIDSGQRGRVHQQRAFRLLPGTPDHVHAVPAQQQERRCPCGVEKLVQGP